MTISSKIVLTMFELGGNISLAVVNANAVSGSAGIGRQA